VVVSDTEYSDLFNFRFQFHSPKNEEGLAVVRSIFRVYIGDEYKKYQEAVPASIPDYLE